jgi:hypothetical protein
MADFYRLMEDQIREGTASAQRASAAFGRGGSIGTLDGASGARASGDSAPAMLGTLSRMFEMYMQSWTTWLSMFERFADFREPGSGAPPFPEPGDRWSGQPRQAADADPQDATPAAPSVPVRIELRCARPADVLLVVRSGLTAQHSLHTLRAADPNGTAIDGVRIDASDVPAVIEIDVPADQAPGIYTGAIVDMDANRAVGSVTVTVSG